jgi:hypothetical protein
MPDRAGEASPDEARIFSNNWKRRAEARRLLF